MTLHERADKLLALREDLYEMHFHQVDREWLIEAMVDFSQLPQQEISDESWEGCDGCTEQDEIMYKNGYVKGYNAAISELPKEISDEEIENYADEHTTTLEMYVGFLQGAKWYREQLKQKQ